MKSLVRMFPLLAIFGFGACGSDDRPPTRAEVPGKYVGAYANGRETIEIKTDGTFEQVFKVGGTVSYSSTGKWEIDGKQVIFSPFKSPGAMYDRGDTWTVPSQRGDWNRDPVRVEFGPWPYFVTKDLEK